MSYTDLISFAKDKTLAVKLVSEIGKNSALNGREYNADLAKLCSVLTMDSYDLPWTERKAEDCAIYKSLTSIGFGDIVFFTGTASTEVDCVLASSDSFPGSAGAKTVFLCCVGSHHGQWYDNFDCGSDDIHKGFSACEQFVFGKLTAYLSDIGASADTRFIICGHSRGGAASGMTAAQLIDEGIYDPANIFAYTFASPAYCRSEKKFSTVYNGIFNILNESDFVVKCMPAKWGYGRYGKDVSFPDLSTENFNKGLLDRVNRFYNVLSAGKTYFPYPKGEKTVGRLADILCKYVSSSEEYYTKLFSRNGSKITLHEFFTKSLCTVTAEIDNPEKYNEGVKYLLDTFVRQANCARLFTTIADFFIIFEGLAGVTKGKISHGYFSSTHEMTTYCACMLSFRTGELLFKNRMERAV